MPRSLAVAGEEIREITLHAFGDASGQGLAAAVYAVVQQHSVVTQGLVAAKARLAKEGLTIPRLELVAGHMAANLLTNVRDALIGFPVKSLYAWLDSSVALHWIRGSGEYKQFVSNRVRKIREKTEITWRHVPSQENPSDLASRGGLVKEDNSLWWNGPTWLKEQDSWPPDIITVASPESNAEAKASKQIFALAVESNDVMDELLLRSSLWRTLRVGAWVARFLRNSKSPRNQRIKGPLTTEEINKQRLFWEKKTQKQWEGSDQFQEDQLRLNLQPNRKEVLECRGRIQGNYPVYLPDSALYTLKFVQHAHEITLHGGVGLTMAKVRESHWIPRLRKLVKRVIKQCYGCKRFQITAFANPPQGNLPRDRTEGNSPFQVVGVDYAGPIKYHRSKNDFV